MRQRPKAEVSTPSAFFVDGMAYTVLRQNIKQLQSRCVSLLEVLDAETPQGRSTLERLEETISEASE